MNTNGQLGIYQIKACAELAVIAIEEALKIQYGTDEYKYWKEVKQEINNS